MSLRPYQRAAVDAVQDALLQPGRHPLVVMPTGSGKSHVIAELVRETLEAQPDAHMLVVTHVRELVEQNHHKLLAAWPEAPVGVYSCLLYTSPSPRDRTRSRMPSSA